MSNEKVMKCPYCKRMASWVMAWAIFKDDEKKGTYWWCDHCDAYTRCWGNTMQPMGSLANKELRRERIKVSMEIDQYIKPGGSTMKEVRDRLKAKLGFNCSVGWLTLEQCQQVREAIPRILGVIR